MISANQIRTMFQEAVRPLQNRLMLIVGRAVLEAVNDSTKLQSMKIQLMKGETRDGFERFQEYGFTSNPQPMAECVVVFPGGNRDHGLIIAVDDRNFRLKNLASGEVALYTDEGDKIHFKRGKEIEISGDSKVVIKSDNIELGKAALEKIVNGESFQTLYNSHTHLGNLGVPTGSPLVPMGGAHLSSVVKGAT